MLCKHKQWRQIAAWCVPCKPCLARNSVACGKSGKKHRMTIPAWAGNTHWGSTQSVCIRATSSTPGSESREGKFPFLWGWGDPHPSPVSSGAALEFMSCSCPGGSSGAGQRWCCCWGGCVYLTVGEHQRAFRLPKRMLQKFEMCRWHRICVRTFVSWWKSLFRSSQLLLNH